MKRKLILDIQMTELQKQKLYMPFTLTTSATLVTDVTISTLNDYFIIGADDYII